MSPRAYVQHLPHKHVLANICGGLDGHAVEVYGERLLEGLRFEQACVAYELVRKGASQGAPARFPQPPHGHAPCGGFFVSGPGAVFVPIRIVTERASGRASERASEQTLGLRS